MIYIEERKTDKVPGTTSLFLIFNYKKEIIDIIKSLDCRVFNKKKNEWEIPICYFSFIINKLSDFDTISVKLLKVKVEKQEQVIILNPHITNPYKYQEDGIKYGLQRDKWLLLDDPGLGKTLQAIYLAEELKEKYSIKHCLIICGINNLKFNWKKEIEKHSALNCTILGQKINSKGHLVIGSVEERLKHLKSNIEEFFIITNIETLRSKQIVTQLIKNNYDMIVVDEIHCAKSSQSEQGKGLLKLKKAKYKLGMTGTLLLNDPLDCYVPLKWIDVERSNFTNFKYFYCNYGGPFNNTLLGYKHLNLLQYQLKHNSLRRKIDILGLPERTIIPEFLEMDSKQASFYDNIREGIVDEIDKVEMNTTSILALSTRLRQATALPKILSSENIESIKIQRTIELVEEITLQGNKVVIFSTFKEPVYELAKKLSKYNPVVCTGDQKDLEIFNNMDKFQQDETVKVFIATWQKCGVGITLNRATYAIFIDTPWTDGAFEQACARIRRIGTKDPTFIYNLICLNTIDERVYEILNDKKALSEYVLDGLITKKGVESLLKYIKNLKNV